MHGMLRAVSTAFFVAMFTKTSALAQIVSVCLLRDGAVAN